MALSSIAVGRIELCSNSHRHQQQQGRRNSLLTIRSGVEPEKFSLKSTVSLPRIAEIVAGWIGRVTESERSSVIDGSKVGMMALTLSALMQLSPVCCSSVQASEFNVLRNLPASDSYVVDDANVLNRVTTSDIKRLLADLEERKGYHINVVTLRKLSSKADAFEFADQVLEKWYPTLEDGNKKGVVILVTTQKEGAVTGGPAFIDAVGNDVLEAVVSENLPVLATDERYNEAMYTTSKRLVAAIDGLPDIPGPKFQETKRESNFKSKQETEEKRGQFVTVVGGLLVIAFVVPMAQYYAYISKK